MLNRQVASYELRVASGERRCAAHAPHRRSRSHLAPPLLRPPASSLQPPASLPPRHLAARSPDLDVRPAVRPDGRRGDLPRRQPLRRQGRPVRPRRRPGRRAPSPSSRPAAAAAAVSGCTPTTRRDRSNAIDGLLRRRPRRRRPRPRLRHRPRRRRRDRPVHDGSATSFPTTPNWRHQRQSVVRPRRPTRLAGRRRGPSAASRSRRFPAAIKLPPGVAETIFRLHDDVIGRAARRRTTTPACSAGRPSTTTTARQQHARRPDRRHAAGPRLRRQLLVARHGRADQLRGASSACSPPTRGYGSFLYEVSVAVFHKREDDPDDRHRAGARRRARPRRRPAALLRHGTTPTTSTTPSQDIRPGQWIALAGVHPTTGKFLLKWYRLLSLDDETDDSTQSEPAAYTAPAATRWSKAPTGRADRSPPNTQVATNLRAILLPGVIGVTTQTVKLETE